MELIIFFPQAQLVQQEQQQQQHFYYRIIRSRTTTATTDSSDFRPGLVNPMMQFGPPAQLSSRLLLSKLIFGQLFFFFTLYTYAQIALSLSVPSVFLPSSH